MHRNPWADLIFHVLAHVRATAHLAASVYDGAYVERVERAVGHARHRALALDAEALGRAAPDHETLAHAQLVAWLFTTPGRAQACADRELGALTAADVDAPRLLPLLTRAPVATAAELLRCAAELERETHSELAWSAVNEDVIARAMSRVGCAAPELARCEITLVPALRQRGRILGRSIWVGLPSPDLGLSVEHVAWQAAHEATVGEVEQTLRDQGAAITYARAEYAAIVLLEERAHAAALAGEHAAWRSHLDAPSSERARADLDGEAERAVSSCLER